MGVPIAAGGSAWRSTLPDDVPAFARRWLQHPGSLSARLRALGHFAVSVEREGRDRADREDADALSLQTGAAIWRRDVVLLVDDEPVVRAHSVTPLDQSTCHWAALRALGTRPLADILYDDPTVTRSAILYRALFPTDPLFAQAETACPELGGPQIWARRSMFVRHLAPLVVIETFLPTLWRKAGVGGT